MASVIITFALIRMEPSLSLWNLLPALMIRMDWGIFFWPRILLGIVAPIVLAVMIHSTVQIRHTQSATGLLYVAVVTLLFGEFFSKFLLFAARLPF